MGEPITLALAGASGRMGRAVLELLPEYPDVQLAAALTAPGDPSVGRSVRSGALELNLADRLEAPCDVLLDFSMPAGTMAWLAFCERREIPMVVGVTGHGESDLARIRETAHQIPIVLAANFSVGVNAILEVLTTISRQLGEGYDIEIIETHHRNKRDAPSGTALTLIQELSEAGPKAAKPPEVIRGRLGRTGPRPSGQIGVHSLRMGDVVGRHEIHFSGHGETVTITHEAHSRAAFAAGALRAVRWIVGRGAGFYSMSDVLSAQPPTPG